MNTTHVTMAVPHGMRGGVQCPTERIDTPASGSRSRSRGLRPLAWAVVASVLAASTVACGQGFSSLMFGMDNNSDLWLMEVPSGTSSGTATLLLSSALPTPGVNGLAYDSARDQLFAVDKNKTLWYLQGGGTSFTSLGSVSAALGQPVSAAYYNDAYWFLGDGSPGNLLGKVSLSYSGGVPAIASGTTFTIAGMPTTKSGGGDMVITAGGKLYAYSAPVIGNFFTVDVTTAASGTVGGYSLIKSSSNTGLQLALGEDGTTLYGTNTSTGNWFTVDTSNGNLTQIPGFQTTGFNDLAGSAIGNPVVPEPSTYAMALVGLACGGFSMWRRRSRC